MRDPYDEEMERLSQLSLEELIEDMDANIDDPGMAPIFIDEAIDRLARIHVDPATVSRALSYLERVRDRRTAAGKTSHELDLCVSLIMRLRFTDGKGYQPGVDILDNTP